MLMGLVTMLETKVIFNWRYYLITPFALYEQEWSDSVAKYGSHQFEEPGFDFDIAMH